MDLKTSERLEFHIALATFQIRGRSEHSFFAPSGIRFQRNLAEHKSFSYKYMDNNLAYTSFGGLHAGAYGKMG